MFQFRPNYRFRAKQLKHQGERREILKKEISSARTLQKLREVLISALEEGEL